MTTQISRDRLYQYGRETVEQSLSAWSAQNKAIERDSFISIIVIRAKPPSDAWMLLKSMVESNDSSTGRERARKEFDELDMIVREPARE